MGTVIPNVTTTRCNMNNEKQLSKTKKEWCQYGLNKEHEFLKKYEFLLGDNGLALHITANADKATNKYAHDFVLNGIQPCDLKFQGTPFRTSERYGIHPDYAITINAYDLERYTQLYPNIVVIFWINYWFEEIRYGTLADIKALCTDRNLHTYARDIGHDNARESHVLDFLDLNKATRWFQHI